MWNNFGKQVTYYLCLRWPWSVRVRERITFPPPSYQDKHLCLGFSANSVAPTEKAIPRLSKLLRFISLVHDHDHIQGISL